MNEPAATRPRYVPPAGDEPLDEIELALVRALVEIIAKDIRNEQAAAEAAAREGPLTDGGTHDGP
jgi:hypothetical protein